MNRICTVEACERPHCARGYCTKHYARWRKYGDPGFIPRGRGGLPTPCSVTGCDENVSSHGMCRTHWRRFATRGTTDPAPPRLRHDFVDANGYLRRYLDGQRQAQYVHRLVMVELLGRPLLPSESVHHVNGNRTDNRPVNLELWSSSQPAGQRVEDKVAWAVEILTTYHYIGRKLMGHLLTPAP